MLFEQLVAGISSNERSGFHYVWMVQINILSISLSIWLVTKVKTEVGLCLLVCVFWITRERNFNILIVDEKEKKVRKERAKERKSVGIKKFNNSLLFKISK
jgi:hypothetical protein